MSPCWCGPSCRCGRCIHEEPPRSIYLVDYACYYAGPTCRLPISSFIEHCKLMPSFYDDRHYYNKAFEAAMIEQSKSGACGDGYHDCGDTGLVGMAVAVVVIRGLVGMVVVVLVTRRPEGMALVVVAIRGLCGGGCCGGGDTSA
ncbi:uncharacterized protein LOC120639922 [Panicum virgatum]|uniref:uncharacterized protein LOC120639922 n=1 Tax=Panicum virgatum TaxID=38727 RepID=UPI0019D62226|nr:uncharacterized protein LOC120639922 [Panicum virgatum]